MAKTEIRIDSKRFRRKLNRLEFVMRDGKLIRSTLRKVAKPWPESVNNQVYSYVTRRTGKMKKPIGLQTFESKSRMQFGVKARPIMSKSNAGWRAHFFATPARQIGRGKRIPFEALYRSKDGEVLSNLSTMFGHLFKKYLR